MDIAIDTETTLSETRAVTPTLVCVSWSTVNEDQTLRAGLFHHSEAQSAVHRAFSKGNRLIFANARFDLAVLRQWDPTLTTPILNALAEGRVIDVLLIQRILDIEKGVFRGYADNDGEWVTHKYSLAAVSRRYGYQELDKDTWRLRYSELIDTPLRQWPEGAKQYAIEDAKATLYTWRKQQSKLHVDTAVWTRFDYVLGEMMKTGMCTDPEAVQQLEISTRQKIEAIQPELEAQGLVEVANARVANTIDWVSGEVVQPEWKRNTKNVQARVLAVYGEDAPRTDNGTVRTDHQVCDESGDEVLHQYSEYAKLLAVVNKDLKFLQQPSVHTRYTSVMSTGRTSSSDPNLQNIRRFPGIRECFVPREGRVYLDADYGSAELHTLAQTCLTLFGESELAKVLNAGRDVHLDMAAQLLGMSYEDISRAYNEGDKEAKHARQLAKIPNYGAPGGMGAATLVAFAAASGVKIDEKQSRHLLKQWKLRYPEMVKYFQYISEYVDAGQPVRLPYDGRGRKTDRFTAAANYLFQGSAATAAAIAGWDIYTRTQHPDSILYGSELVLFAHDQFVLEIDASKAERAKLTYVQLMVDGFNKVTPDVPVRAECEIKERWSK